MRRPVGVKWVLSFFSLDKVFLPAKLLLSRPFHPHSSGSDFFAQCQLGVLVTTVDDRAIPLLIEHGADLTIRNNKGQTLRLCCRARHGTPCARKLATAKK
jgi:hypothetical protein